jgi:hypothetical protein
VAPVTAEPQDLTPPWPLHAPDRVAPLNAVPSLQVAVAVAAVCALLTLAGIRSARAKNPESKIFRIAKSLWFRFDRTFVLLNQGADIRVGAALIVEAGLRERPDEAFADQRGRLTPAHEKLVVYPPSETTSTATM